MTWIFWLFVIGSIGYDSIAVVGQQVAPGVPPQHYQKVQQQQQQQFQQPQYQQQPPQYQQQPPPPQQFQQQVPIQHPQQVHVPQQQVPVHHQQVPVQQQQHHIPQGHAGGHVHEGQPQLLNAANIAGEKDHIKEHLDVPIDTSKMSEQELQFYYFKMHDADNNNKLDGCELIKSLIHWHDQGNSAPSGESPDHHHSPTAGAKLFTDEELVNLIDPILDMDDTNKDGYIDYSEFILAQQKAAGASNKP